MQQEAVYLLFCKFTLHVSGVIHIHRQEYRKTPILVVFFVQLRATWSSYLGHVERSYDQYRRL